MLQTLKSDDRLANIPVLVLTTSSSLADVTRCYSLHANAYLTKPFEPRELVARIRSVLRRAGRAAPSPGEDLLYEFEGWHLDPVKHRLTDPAGAVIAISTAEFRMLTAFLDHPRSVMSRDRLLDMVQGREAQLFDRAVDNQVSRLRRKIEEDSRDPQLIQTVRGGGYRFTPDVARVAAKAD